MPQDDARAGPSDLWGRFRRRTPWLLLSLGALLVVLALAFIASWTRMAYVALGVGAVCLGAAWAVGLAIR